jgi:ubiquinone/menaquinone biosynthesis C-methylase UbiE
MEIAMSGPQIRFNDGAAYDRGMGQWSLPAGNIFLDWLAPETGLRWIDVGCGSGAFSELIATRCAPSESQGVDPSDAQLAFARTRPATRNAVFQVGDAMALPFPNDRFDAAVMALVIFFVPDPAKGVAEMVRVVRPGGIVAAYAWDNLGGGFPFAPIIVEMRAMGFDPPQAPSVEASRLEAMRDLWTRAGLQAVETREITVSRSFNDFEDFWSQSTLTGSTRPMIAAMQPADIEQVKARVQARMMADAQGRITHTARANAVKGRVPA